MGEQNKKELPEEDRKIFEAIEKNNPVLLKTLISERKNVNILDENAMTPLQHAVYKGNKEMVQMLLDQGADVNLCEHQHNYTSLHFAGLSGNVDICLALLLAGAKPTATNTVGRTPSQMAAFVGNHNCVAVINNYVPKSDIEYYTKTKSAENKPYLPPFLSESFHKFIMQVNIHPVKVILNAESIVGLSDHLAEVKKVLELMSEREMSRAEKNEAMALKFHYLSYLINELHKYKSKQGKKEETEEEKKMDTSEFFARKLLKPNKEGNLEFLDAFIKECIREFNYRDSTLFKQIVASLAHKDSDSALGILIAAVNGQRGFNDTSVCNTCGEEKPAKKCSKCKVVQYCDRNCQRLHWHWHKKACARLSQQAPVETAKATPDPNELSNELQNLLAKN